MRGYQFLLYLIANCSSTLSLVSAEIALKNGVRCDYLSIYFRKTAITVCHDCRIRKQDDMKYNAKRFRLPLSKLAPRDAARRFKVFSQTCDRNSS